MDVTIGATNDIQRVFNYSVKKMNHVRNFLLGWGVGTYNYSATKFVAHLVPHFEAQWRNHNGYLCVFRKQLSPTNMEGRKNIYTYNLVHCGGLQMMQRLIVDTLLDTQLLPIQTKSQSDRWPSFLYPKSVHLVYDKLQYLIQIWREDIQNDNFSTLLPPSLQQHDYYYKNTQQLQFFNDFIKIKNDETTKTNVYKRYRPKKAPKKLGARRRKIINQNNVKMKQKKLIEERVSHQYLNYTIIASRNADDRCAVCLVGENFKGLCYILVIFVFLFKFFFFFFILVLNVRYVCLHCKTFVLK